MVPPHNNDPNLNIAERSEKIKAYFHEHLGLVPSDEGRVYIGFLVPRGQEDQLMPFLKRLEADSVSPRVLVLITSSRLLDDGILGNLGLPWTIDLRQQRIPGSIYRNARHEM